MIEFVKAHWKAYLVAALVAVALGLGLSYVVGQAWSTPDEAEEETVEAESESDSGEDES